MSTPFRQHEAPPNGGQRNGRALRLGEVLHGEKGATYRIIRFLAEGGYSEVWEAVCEQTGLHYAVKTLQIKHTDNRKTLTRQHREAKTLYLLRHPNVVRVDFIGVREEDGLVYMIMELLVGRTLRELQRDAGGRLPIPWVLEIMVGVTAGLEAVHLYAVHRDIKPENIHVGDNGRVCLFDLGASKFPKENRITTGGMTLGTAQYMSPEQLVRPTQIDGRSDLFAVGVLLYELCSGASPWATDGAVVEDRMVLGNQIIHQPHTPLIKVAPHLPEYLVEIIECCLSKQPEDRFKSAVFLCDLLRAALKRYRDELGPLAPAPLASVIGGIPRAAAPSPSASTPSSPSRNPFVTVSLPEAASQANPGPQETRPSSSAETAAEAAQADALATTDPSDTGAFAQAMEAAARGAGASPVTEPVDTGALAQVMEGAKTEEVDTGVFAQAMEAGQSAKTTLDAAASADPCDTLKSEPDPHPEPTPPDGATTTAVAWAPPSQPSAAPTVKQRAALSEPAAEAARDRAVAEERVPSPRAAPRVLQSRAFAALVVAGTACMVTLAGLSVVRWLKAHPSAPPPVAVAPVASPAFPAVPSSSVAPPPFSALPPSEETSVAPPPGASPPPAPSAHASASASVAVRPASAPKPPPRPVSSRLPSEIFDFDPPPPPKKRGKDPDGFLR